MAVPTQAQMQERRGGADTMNQGGVRTGGTQGNTPETVEYRAFEGVNFTDARTAIGDTEFYWLENAMRIGSGNLRLVPHQGTSVATITSGVRKMTGFQLQLTSVDTPVLIIVGNDGSLVQLRLDTFVQTTFAGAGTVTAACRMSQWQDNTVLIVDPTNGYMQWDGATFTVIDPSRKATDIEVFEGRAWLLTSARAISFTAPDSFTDFTVLNGGGTVTINDRAFTGKVIKLHSALEQLWVVGPGAVNSISNVQTGGTPVTTTFSNTNIVTNVGTTMPSSVGSFFRTFVFLAPYGVYAIVGSTPQKLSDKLDRLFPLITFEDGTDYPSAVTSLYDVFLYCQLVRLTDPFGNAERPLLLCFGSGKWFFADQGSLTWVTTAIGLNGKPIIWGTDGSHVYQVFGAADTTAVDYKIVTKLYPFGLSVLEKEWLRVGLEFDSDQVVTVSLTGENEFRSQALNGLVVALNTITFVGTGVITFTGTGPITWVGDGLQIVRQSAGMVGRYLGLTLEGSSAPFVLSSIAWEIKRGTGWA